MKKILWIVLILILLFVLFLWLKPKETQQAQSSNQQPQAVQTAQTKEIKSDETLAPASVVANVVTPNENTTDELPQQLGSYVVLKNAWITAPPPGSNVAAAYMDISNTGRAAAKVVSVESSDFEEMMFHRTVIENGVASMQGVDFIEVTSGSPLSLEPNGLHVMAMGPERDLKAGDQVTVSFTLDNGETHTANLPVR